MNAWNALKNTVLGLGLALGLAHMAMALPGVGTYSGPYSGKLVNNTTDNGTATVVVAPDGAVQCAIASATGRGTITGTGKARQAVTIFGEVLEGRMFFNCSHETYPGYITISGGQTNEKGVLTGLVLTATTDGTTQMVANLSLPPSGGGTAPQPATPLSPQAITGLWYDPASNGTGFNLIAADNGFFATYYGRNAAGGPLWLISTEVPTGTLQTNTLYTTTLGATTAGTFSQPAYAVETWGQLDITFQSCSRATATLSGKDGVQYLQLERLTTITGAGGC